MLSLSLATFLRPVSRRLVLLEAGAVRPVMSFARSIPSHGSWRHIALRPRSPYSSRPTARESIRLYKRPPRHQTAAHVASQRRRRRRLRRWATATATASASLVAVGLSLVYTRPQPPSQKSWTPQAAPGRSAVAAVMYQVPISIIATSSSQFTRTMSRVA